MRVKGRRTSKNSKLVNSHVGQRLRGRRVLLGLSQAQLAGALGVTFQQIQKYENGQSQVTPERIVALASALGVSVDFFFEGLPDLKDGSGRGATLVPEEEAQDSQMLALVRCYGQIADRDQRRSFLHLVLSVANSDMGSGQAQVC